MTRARTHVALCCLVLAASTLAVYSRAGGNGFVNFDDGGYITANPQVQAGLTAKSILWAWTSGDMSNWHPLTWMSHELDCQIYGLNPAGHHWTSVILHTLNVVLLFLLLFYATRRMGRSLLVAALFALHPFNVESVAWVSERKNVLSTLLFLLTLAAYGWYALRPSAKRYLLMALAFALALTAKPMVITLPFVLLLLDIWPMARIRVRSEKPLTRKSTGDSPVLETAVPAFSKASFSRLVLEKAPLLLLCVASAVITIMVQQAAGSIQALTKLPLEFRIENGIGAYALYVWKAFWPTRLCAYYPLLSTYFPAQQLSLPGWQLGLAIAFLLAVTALTWQQRFTRRYLLMGWLWYLGTLVPVIGIVQVGDQAMADRYAYIPLIGIFIIVVWALAEWADGRDIPTAARMGISAIVLVLLTLLTWRQIGFWRDSYAMWTRALQVTNNNLLAEINTGDALRDMGREREGLPYLQRAAELDPPDPSLHVRLAYFLGENGQTEDAIREYQAAIQLTQNPRIVGPSFESIAALYATLGDYKNVRETFRQAVRSHSEIVPGLIRDFSKRATGNAVAGDFLSLGILLQEAGERSQARDAYREALKLNPGLEEAQESLQILGSGAQ